MKQKALPFRTTNKGVLESLSTILAPSGSNRKTKRHCRFPCNLDWWGQISKPENNGALEYSLEEGLQQYIQLRIN